MKMLSPILKVVALLAAAFCVYAWLDVRGKVSSAEAEMADFNGTVLAEKASHAKAIFKQNKERAATIESFKKRVASLEKDINSVNSELESERSKVVAANADIAKRNSDIRSLNSKLAVVTKQVEERDATIEALKKEILASKELLAKQDDTEALKEKIANLERNLAEQKKELDKALQKAKIADMAEVVEVIETDAQGNKIKRKIVKVPYVPTGDIATVVSVKDNIVVLNRGKKNGLAESQQLLLKADGNVIAKAVVVAVDDVRAVLFLNMEAGIPEIIKENSQYELASEIVAEAKKEEKPAEEKAEAETEEKSE